MRLPRAQTHDVLCERDLRATMDDGAVLLADRWVARATRDHPQPTVLVRSPYGRRQLVGLIFGRLLAERGLASRDPERPGDVRLRGRLQPLRRARRRAGHPALDPRAAVARRADRDVRAELPRARAVGASRPRLARTWRRSRSRSAPRSFTARRTPGAACRSRRTASWLVLVAAQERRLAPLAIAGALQRLPAVLSELPLSDLDERATGAEVDWYREAIASTCARGRLLGGARLRGRVADVTAPGPAHRRLVRHLPALDARGLRRAARGRARARSSSSARGRIPLRGSWRRLREGLAGCARSCSATSGCAPGERCACSSPASAPEAAGATLEPGRRRGRASAACGSPPTVGCSEREPGAGDAGGDRYRYDPADPTPVARRPGAPGARACRRQPPARGASRRTHLHDAPLPEALEAIGPVRVELWVRTSSPYFDLFARVCDVDASGVSCNVCDALPRVVPEQFEEAADGSRRVAFDLWPTAHRFAAGHRIRLQVSSGAHPRYARNPGTGEDPATATRLRPSTSSCSTTPPTPRCWCYRADGPPRRHQPHRTRSGGYRGGAHVVRSASSNSR